MARDYNKKISNVSYRVSVRKFRHNFLMLSFTLLKKFYLLTEVFFQTTSFSLKLYYRFCGKKRRN